MKAIRTLLLITILALASCKNRKEVVHSYQKDSTVFRSEVVVDTLLIPRDSFSGELPLAVLQQLGEYTLRGDRTTTKIYYRDGNIGAVTDSDSIMKLILSKITTTETTSQQATLPSPVQEQEDSTFVKALRWLSLLAFIILIIVFIFKDPFSWTKSNLK